ncbi:arylamine N-acetyltransferase [Saccharopolyspora rhizosphaerae]|uniref:Arylamine N-acetyltransferase n=1 Tax=Saccharopolyspora rhizosphaerae TaxID=2492662 RepID=A0A3R8QS26_9PSEU|nr:arylamine N-acetyltransferase [Saccharopolyspora rhizosphaerae]RRO18277.1 arylamine N-acetyltransferase [Saccharopolyspora rhizosphaerae]
MTDPQDVEALDLDAYLARTGQSAAPPSAASLAALHEAHVRTIPFENVDPASGRTPQLDLGSITDKLVRKQRGGYCFEHGLLFAAVLERLGYEVSRRAARVQPHRGGPRTHMNLVVTVDGVEHLADVGFGAGVLRPMPLEDGAVVDQAGWKHRLVRDGRAWTLQKETAEGWEPLHAFDDQPQRLIDYEVFNHYTATHPNSPFTGKLVVMRLDHGISRKLIGDTLIVERPDGSQEIAPVADRGDALRYLDVVLTDEELAALEERLLQQA